MEFESDIKYRGTIVCGFFGVGKSSVAKYRPDIKFYDLDAKAFVKQDGWQNLYVDCALGLTHDYDIVCLKSSDKVMRRLNQLGQKYYIVYPNRFAKRDFMERAIKNKYPRKFIEQFFSNWERYIQEIEDEDCPNKIVLQSGEYLSDIVDRLVRFRR